MRFSVKFLKNVANVNNFDFADQWMISEGSRQELYFQLVNKDKDDLRYITQAMTFMVDVIFLDIELEDKIRVSATKPFADDKSIFKIVLSENQVPNSGNVEFVLVENGISTKFKVDQGIVVELLESGSC